MIIEELDRGLLFDMPNETGKVIELVVSKICETGRFSFLLA